LAFGPLARLRKKSIDAEFRSRAAVARSEY
jgi:hypothetical protein